MKSRFILLLLLLFFNYNYLAKAFELKIKKVPAPNLLKNTRFRNVNKKVPENWVFYDCTKKPGFILNFCYGVFDLKTPGQLYGYLGQYGVPVKEGEKYYAEVEVKLSSRALLWIMTPDYDDKLSALGEPKSSTKIYSQANPEQGANLVQELKNFIDSDYLLAFSPLEWNYCKLEFKVPTGHKITKYDFRIGAYGGKKGWIKFRNPVFSLAEQKVQLILLGKNLSKINIVHPSGKVECSFPLNSDKVENRINVTLNSRITKYFAEIIDEKGKVYRRAL